MLVSVFSIFLSDNLQNFFILHIRRIDTGRDRGNKKGRIKGKNRKRERVEGRIDKERATERGRRF
jgi:hypothetical protein